WSEVLRFATTIVADERVTAALENPRLSTGDKEALLLSIAGDRVTGDGRSFLRVLIEADRIALLPQIRALFDQLKDDAEHVAKATRTPCNSTLPKSASSSGRRSRISTRARKCVRRAPWCRSPTASAESTGFPMRCRARCSSFPAIRSASR